MRTRVIGSWCGGPIGLMNMRRREVEQSCTREPGMELVDVVAVRRLPFGPEAGGASDELRRGGGRSDGRGYKTLSFLGRQLRVLGDAFRRAGPRELCWCPDKLLTSWRVIVRFLNGRTREV